MPITPPFTSPKSKSSILSMTTPPIPTSKSIIFSSMYHSNSTTNLSSSTISTSSTKPISTSSTKPISNTIKHTNCKP